MDAKDVELVSDAISLIATANRDEFMSWRNHDLLSEAENKLRALLTFYVSDEESE